MLEDGLVVLRALLFGVSVSLTYCVCGSPSGAANVPLRPPDWVFGVVWPCLYATTGAAWALGGARADLVLASITLLCCWWLVAYVCLRQRTVAALTLVAVVALSVFGIVLLRGLAGGLLAPLAAWTAFATYLNVYETFFEGDTEKR